MNGLQKARPGTPVKAIPWDVAAPLMAPVTKPAEPKTANGKPETGVAHVR
ncbi:MAG: hypothetical protein NTY60_00680 [Proteobacteria bacterium]|nr:hypothetical protein [Pseudomonadota bacterium]